MPHRAGLTVLLAIALTGSGCSDSYEFKDNTLATSPDSSLPSANADGMDEAVTCGSDCQADGQSSGGA